MEEQAPQPFQPQIVITEAQMAGVWANFARVGHSPYEFTLDFARIDFGETPPQGIVVARVSLSPLLVQQLIDALQDNWRKFAEKSLPPEVFGSATERESRGNEAADDDGSAS